MLQRNTKRVPLNRLFIQYYARVDRSHQKKRNVVTCTSTLRGNSVITLDQLPHKATTCYNQAARILS
jgi:hypothetical protein